jgi:Holliday junction resolvase RusA-like endonuclease
VIEAPEVFSLWLPGLSPPSGNITRVVKGRTRGWKTPLIPIRAGGEWQANVRDLATLRARMGRWARLDALAVAVRVVVVRPVPKSRRPGDRPTTRPDLENYLKRLLDALNGVVYRDDAEICWLLAEKTFGSHPGVLILATRWDAGDGPKALMGMEVEPMVGSSILSDHKG